MENKQKRFETTETIARFVNELSRIYNVRNGVIFNSILNFFHTHNFLIKDVEFFEIYRYDNHENNARRNDYLKNSVSKFFQFYKSSNEELIDESIKRNIERVIKLIKIQDQSIDEILNHFGLPTIESKKKYSIPNVEEYKIIEEKGDIIYNTRFKFTIYKLIETLVDKINIDSQQDEEYVKKIKELSRQLLEYNKDYEDKILVDIMNLLKL